MMATNVRLREIFEFTTYGNQELCDFINQTYADYDLSREAAYATVRWLAKKYPEMNETLKVKTTSEERVR